MSVRLPPIRDYKQSEASLQRQKAEYQALADSMLTKVGREGWLHLVKLCDRDLEFLRREERARESS